MLNRGSQNLLRSAEVEEWLGELTAAVVNAAGDGFEAEVTLGRTRAFGSVRATTYEAATRENNDYALTRALDAARD